MSLDLKVNPNTRDLAGGWASGVEEILQRLVTRLNRELSEWFLATQAGIPWRADGSGLLGSKDTTLLTALLRQEILNTDGILRVLSLKVIQDNAARSYSVYAQILVQSSDLIDFWLTEEGAKWLQA